MEYQKGSEGNQWNPEGSPSVNSMGDAYRKHMSHKVSSVYKGNT